MTIRMFGVDSNNDMYTGPDGNIAIVTGLEAVKQACEHVMKTMLTEMVLAYNQGLPNFQIVWVGAPNIPQFEAAARAALQAVPDVIQVAEFDTIVQNNVLAYTAVIQTNFGDAVING